MQPLEKSLRNKLESTIKEARDIAELAAKAALEQLGVGAAVSFKHLNEAEKELRRKLRIHGRQLGDILNADNIQALNILIEEVAYEHWHRMLFAKFLAENNLLMYPDPVNPVPVSLNECEDLAADEGAKNGWELASRFAAKMLPQIFRMDSPVFQLILPPEHQLKLEKILNELPAEIFKSSDSLGWVYQFWQSKKKEEVNASEVKIGARELPAVTQLFTEPYMVSFLLDNSLGAWWVAKIAGLKGGNELRPGARQILRTAETEEELRKFFALSGVPLEYLRFIKTETGSWIPAAGTFEKWPNNLSELKTLDPSCGSGHFLVAALLMLVAMRMELEKITAREAMDSVLRDNIHGLELDRRCVELAAFALALTAWKYPKAGGYRILPELNIACSGLSVSVAKEEWKQLAPDKHNLRIAIEWMYDVFKDAPVLGSLLDPRKTASAKIIEWKELSGYIEQALSREQTEEQHEAGVVAHGLVKAAVMLSDNYNWVITNVPYLARGKQTDVLKDYCERNYPEAKTDLATVFLDRCLELCIDGGTASIVLPQNWLFLTTYKKFREKLLVNCQWHLIARLGPKGFSTPMWDFNVQLITISRCNVSESEGLFAGNKLSINFIHGLDVSELRTSEEKARQLVSHEIKSVEQAKQLKNPDARIALEKGLDTSLLSEYADGLVGLQTSDDPMFLSAFWEHGSCDKNIWEYLQATPDVFKEYAGQSWLVKWERGEGLLLSLPTAYPTKGLKALGKLGIAIHRMGQLFPYHYGKERFHQNVATIVPNNPTNTPAIWCFCSSPGYSEAVRQIDQALKVTNATLVKVPFDLSYWRKIAVEKYPNGLPKPYSDDPTQWIFHGHPCGSVSWDEKKKWTMNGPLRNDASVFQVAVARLLGYQWPAELDSKMELSDESRSLVKKSEELLSHADDDGIVCIPPVRGEASAADRLLNLLAAAYGKEWNNNKLSMLLSESDHAGKSLETWLRDKFFIQHCKLFQHRPFIWHVWDGLRDGFSALVNYHKLNKKLLESLIYTYLGDWISTQKDAITHGIDGAEEKLSFAENLKKRLELILEGEQPYDIFVRWKPLSKQPIGWDPDINDGVRLNIRPFMTARVLRVNKKPQLNVAWDKDRGKDVESAPWYHMFNGDRINDHHLSLEEKKKARGKK